jgi:hypothetical protein
MESRYEVPAAMSAVEAKFELGQVIVTPQVCQWLDNHAVTVEELLERHCSGDWGNVSSTQASFNDEAIHQGMSLNSTYSLASGKSVNVFTRADRQHTLVHASPVKPR